MKLILRIVTFSVAASLLVVPAQLVQAPAHAAVNDQGLSGSSSSMWQTNEQVRSLAVSDQVLYAGGDFTAVRPPSTAVNSANEVSRTYLAAFNATTGELISSFNAVLNGRVFDLAVSPDASRLYLAGSFTTVNGVARSRVAALEIPSGTLDTGFVANANSTATTIAATASTVYVGGDFTSIGGRQKSRFAALDAASGEVNRNFTAELDARPSVITVVPSRNRVLVGGEFTTVNGGPPSGMASVDPTTGAVQPWEANKTQPINSNCAGRVTDILATASSAYVTAEGDPPGCYEGTYAANLSDGSLQWISSCLGASLALAIVDNVLYKGSHQHDCGFMPGGATGGFVGATSRDGFIWRRLVGQNLADGTFVHWYPNTNGAGEDHVGPHALATDGTQLFVGGDFTSVDGQAQQGLTRYGRGNNTAPDTPTAPIVRPTAARTLTVTWPAVIDPDSGTLTYRLYRDGGTSPVYTTTVESYPWTLPWMRFDDIGLAAGSSHSYRLRVTDGTYTSGQSPAGSARARGTPPHSFVRTVQGDQPSLYWRLGGPGSRVVDVSPLGDHPGTTFGGVTGGLPGAIGNNAAVHLDGSTGYLASATPLTLGTDFTESAWFRTTSIRGGVISSMSTSQQGPGGTTDRMITMDNNGNIVFGVRGQGRGGPFGPRLTTVRVQDNSFNDGRWHQVVGTYDGTTLSLYIDGQLLGETVGAAAGMTAGYQRVGYANLDAMQAVFGINFYHLKWPLSEHFNGDIDEVASYNSALSATQIAEQFAAGVQGDNSVVDDITRPTAAGHVTVSSATKDRLHLSWTAASDNVGVAGYRVFRTGVDAPVSAFLPAGSTGFTDTGLSADTSYSYVVRAADAAGNYRDSVTASGRTLNSHHAKPRTVHRAHVVRVIDGDTVRVKLLHRGKRTVRLIGIEAPRGRHGEACGAQGSARSLERLLPKHSSVRLVTDPSVRGRDKKARLWRYVTKIDSRLDVGHRQVARGWATVRSVTGQQEILRIASYHAAERKAADHLRGVWSRCQ